MSGELDWVPGDDSRVIKQPTEATITFEPAEKLRTIAARYRRRAAAKAGDFVRDIESAVELEIIADALEALALRGGS